MDAAALKRKILVVDDDRNTTALIGAYLQNEGFLPLFAHDGHQALDLAKRHAPALIVLDLLLPRADGWEVCRLVRSESDVPVIIVTAREDEMDRVLGLSLGADDYVVKPFSPRELIARIKAVLRRAVAPASKPAGQLKHGGLVFDRDNRTVSLDGKPLALTPSEYKILHALMAAPGRVFLREELLGCLYPVGDPVIDRVIDVHIGKLRQKIEADPSRPRLVLTVRGVGYQFAARAGGAP